MIHYIHLECYKLSVTKSVLTELCKLLTYIYCLTFSPVSAANAMSSVTTFEKLLLSAF
jgi:hypothetical protein